MGQQVVEGTLTVGPMQLALIEQIRNELRQGLVRHLCIWGEPGAGKTRLLYEATGSDDLAPRIAYFRSLQTLEARESWTSSCVMVLQVPFSSLMIVAQENVRESGANSNDSAQGCG